MSEKKNRWKDRKRRKNCKNEMKKKGIESNGKVKERIYGK